MKILEKSKNILMAAFIFGGVLFVSPFEARAAFADFNINCWHTSIKGEATKDMVTVEFFRKGKFLGSVTGFQDCNQANTKTIGDGGYARITTDKDIDSEQVDEVRVIAHGKDAFFIDHAQLAYYSPSFHSRARWGRNSGKGWCLSTDKNDGGSWKDQMTSSGCQPCWQFKLVAKKIGTSGLYGNEAKVYACNHKRTAW